MKNVEYFMSDMIANDGGFNALRYPLSYVDSYLQVQQLQEKFESVMKTMTAYRPSALSVLKAILPTAHSVRMFPTMKRRI